MRPKAGRDFLSPVRLPVSPPGQKLMNASTGRGALGQGLDIRLPGNRAGQRPVLDSLPTFGPCRPQRAVPLVTLLAVWDLIDR